MKRLLPLLLCLFLLCGCRASITTSADPAEFPNSVLSIDDVPTLLLSNWTLSRNKATFSLQNNGVSTLIMNDETELQLKNGDQWHPLSMEEGWASTDMAVEIEPRQAHTYTISFSCYGIGKFSKLPTGDYRLCFSAHWREEEPFILTIPFTIH